MKSPRIITTQMLADRNEYLSLISNLTGISSDVIMSTCRVDSVCIARFLLCWALVQLCGYSTTTVGTLLRRNHTTVWYGWSAIHQEKIQPFGEIQRKVDALKLHHQQRMEAVNA